MTYTCRVCGETKPASDFHRGNHSLCKPCRSAADRAYREANLDMFRARNAAYYLATKERRRANNRESGWASDHRTVQRLRRQGVPIVDWVRRRVVFDRAGGCCQSCGTPLTFRGGERWDVDHIVPVVSGGEHSYANTQALCVPCHGAKSTEERASRAAQQGVTP